MVDRSEQLLDLGAATLGESGARRMDPRVAAVWSGAVIFGPAYAVRCSPGDNLGVHVGVTTAPSGSVLCVDVGGVRELGYWGEVLTTAAQARGLIGLVIDGCVRDVDALRRRGFPVFSTGRALTGATKHQPGEVGGWCSIGGVRVATGDWIVGDVDGVVCIDAPALDSVIESGSERTNKERTMFERLMSGATTVELLELDDSLIVRR